MIDAQQISSQTARQFEIALRFRPFQERLAARAGTKRPIRDAFGIKLRGAEPEKPAARRQAGLGSKRRWRHVRLTGRSVSYFMPFVKSQAGDPESGEPRTANSPNTVEGGSDFWLFLELTVVTLKQPVKRKVLVEIRPVKTERGDFNVIQLNVRAACQSWILCHRKTNLRATFHADDDPAVNVSGRTGCVS
jgi:hypothetical protein